MKTNVYVDGFNLCYGCLRVTRYKWSDFAKVCEIMLPRDSANGIRYFTARVTAGAGDPAQPLRQRTHLRARRTIPQLSIHYGHFLSHRLYTLRDRKKRAAEALSYNGVVQSWPEITRLARESSRPTAAQGALFEQGP